MTADVPPTLSGDPGDPSLPPPPLGTEYLHNWDYVGRCYDVLKIDPMDPGGSATTHLAFAVSAWEVTPDNRHCYPTGFSYAPKGGGYNDKSTQVVSSTYDFKQYFHAAVSVNAGDPTGEIFSTTASGSFASTQNETESNEKTMTFSDEVIFTYVLEVSTTDDPSSRKIDPELGRALLALPSSGGPDSPAFAQFFATFGTHYSTRAEMGGRALQRLVMDKASYNELVEQEVKVSAEASAAFEIAKVGGSASSDSRVSKQFAHAVENVNENLRYAGGVPQPYGMWSLSVADSPAPVVLGLAPISTLLAKAYFPAEAELEARRDLLARATDAYLRTHGVDPSDAVVGHGDRVQLVLGTPDQTLLLVAASDGTVILSSADAAGAGSTWIVMAVGAVGGDNSITIANQAPALLSFKNEDTGSLLDAAWGEDARYARGDGLVGCHGSDVSVASARWSAARADQRDRLQLVSDDPVRLETSWTDPDGEKGYLMRGAEKASKQVFSFGSHDHITGTVWMIRKIDDRAASKSGAGSNDNEGGGHGH